MLKSVFFHKRVFRRKQICAKSQAVALDAAAKCRQRCGELVERGVLSASGGIFRLCSGIDKSRIHLSIIASGHVIAEVAVHCRVIAAEHDRSVVIKILFADPVDKAPQLSARTRNGVGVIIIRILLLIAKTADIPVFEVRIHGQEGEVKGLVSLCEFSEPVFGGVKELHVFHSPENIIITGNYLLFDGPVVVVDLIIPVLSKVQAPSSESRIGSQHKDILIPFALKDISQIGHFLKERVLGIHLIKRAPLICKLLTDIHFQGQSCCLGEDPAHGESGSGQHPPSVEDPCLPGKTLIFEGNFRQFRNVVVGKSSSALNVGISCFHGFKVDIDQVSLLLREFDRYPGGVHIIVFDKSRIIHLIFDIAAQLQPFPGKTDSPHDERDPEDPSPEQHFPADAFPFYDKKDGKI